MSDFLRNEYDRVTVHLERLTASAVAAGKRAEWFAYVEALNDLYWSKVVDSLDASTGEFKTLKSSIEAVTTTIKADLDGIKTFIANVGLLTAATKAMTEAKKLADQISPPMPRGMRMAAAPDRGTVPGAIPGTSVSQPSINTVLREIFLVRLQLAALASAQFALTPGSRMGKGGVRKKAAKHGRGD